MKEIILGIDIQEAGGLVLVCPIVHIRYPMGITIEDLDILVGQLEDTKEIIGEKNGINN